MKRLIFGITITLLFSACSSKDDPYLVKVHQGNFEEIGVPCGYLNAAGDTIVPFGKYDYCFTDTIQRLGMVMEKETGKILGINQQGKELYEVFKYDNGPDYPESGLFRIVKNGKIGYANAEGQIVIEPKFPCAYPFEGEFAKVSDDCVTIQEGEYSAWDSENWYQINKAGKRVAQ